MDIPKSETTYEKYQILANHLTKRRNLDKPEMSRRTLQLVELDGFDYFKTNILSFIRRNLEVDKSVGIRTFTEQMNRYNPEKSVKIKKYWKHILNELAFPLLYNRIENLCDGEDLAKILLNSEDFKQLNLNNDIVNDSEDDIDVKEILNNDVLNMFSKKRKKQPEQVKYSNKRQKSNYKEDYYEEAVNCEESEEEVKYSNKRQKSKNNYEDESSDDYDDENSQESEEEVKYSNKKQNDNYEDESSDYDEENSQESEEVKYSNKRQKSKNNYEDESSDDYDEEDYEKYIDDYENHDSDYEYDGDYKEDYENYE